MDRVPGIPRAAWVAALLALLAIPVVASAKTVIVPPRPGQVGLSAQGQYGGLFPGSGLGEEYGFGPGLAVRLKYRMRYERGLGLSFESQNFDVRSDAEFTDEYGLPISPDTTIAPKRLTLVLSGVDFYQMFGTRTNTTRMLSAGFGLAQVHATLNDGETAYSPDGFYVTVGAGLEKFFYKSLAYDLSGRYLAVFQDSRTTQQFQASLGLVFYATY